MGKYFSSPLRKVASIIMEAINTCSDPANKRRRTLSLSRVPFETSVTAPSISRPREQDVRERRTNGEITRPRAYNTRWSDVKPRAAKAHLPMSRIINGCRLRRFNLYQSNSHSPPQALRRFQLLTGKISSCKLVNYTDTCTGLNHPRKWQEHEEIVAISLQNQP